MPPTAEVVVRIKDVPEFVRLTEFATDVARVAVHRDDPELRNLCDNLMGDMALMERPRTLPTEPA